MLQPQDDWHFLISPGSRTIELRKCQAAAELTGSTSSVYNTSCAALQAIRHDGRRGQVSVRG